MHRPGIIRHTHSSQRDRNDRNRNGRAHRHGDFQNQVQRGVSKIGGRDATILEHNILQTAGSAGESIAFGLGVTMPAIMILGDFTERITTWSTLHNPFFAGPRADLLAMFPFVSLVVLLHLVGREPILRPKKLG